MLEGGCLCGAVRYQVEGEALSSGICHCRTCRKAGSAPTLPFVSFPAAGFAITEGAPAVFHSSPHVTRSFCSRCGSPLTYRSSDHPDSIDVMTCSLDDPEAVPPSFHVWTSHKIEWAAICDDLPAYSTTRKAGLGG